MRRVPTHFWIGIAVILFITSCARLTILNENSETFDGRYALMTTQKRPGFIVMVMEKGIVKRKSAFGYADVEKKIPITEKTQFRLASDTKAFTAAMIHLLEIDPSTSIAHFLPELSHFKAVTVKNLVDHTGGLPAFPDCEMGNVKVFETNASMLQWLSKQKPKFKPGSKYEYSNMGYNVLASIIEKVSKKSFPASVEEKILRPLDMGNSFFISLNNDGKSPDQAKGYGEFPGLEVRGKNSCNYTYGEDGIYTNILDFAKWARYVQTLIPKYPGTKDYTYGWVYADKAYSHSGSWMGFRSYARWYPEKNMWVLILGNFVDLPIHDILRHAPPAVGGAPAP